ncbi:MAG: 16S rRNA (guanine(966)-N(2))-methyltransferase RsmD [Lentisphaerales bacterium]|nr:MAG: 16S rRNA (guanine(966)-N(2))-methyltransferase RsmD [Lentisphaerales bacterium]
MRVVEVCKQGGTGEMRITGGERRGTRIEVPGARVRPTSDMVREALFSALADRIPGCRFIDLFAGSGVVGLEALSRGASFVCWVESSVHVLRVLKENVTRAITGDPLSATRSQVYRSDAIRFLEKGGLDGGAEPFDVIFADPPYDTDGSNAWLRKALKALEKTTMLAAEGLLVFEQAKKQPDELLSDAWQVIRDRTYGGTRVLFLRKS